MILFAGRRTIRRDLGGADAVALLFTFGLLFSLTFLARRHGRTTTR